MSFFFHDRMDSGEERDVSQAPGDEDGGDSSSAFPEQDGDTAALDGQVQAGEDAETDENVAALDRCSEADNAQEGDDKDAHRADSHKLLRTDLDSSEEELTELSPLRDGGGDRIHTPLMTYQLFLEEDDAEKHEDIDVGDKDSEADGSVGQEGLEHHIEVHQEREEVEQEGVPPPAESQLLSIVDNERKDEKSEDYKDNQEDKGMPMSDDLPGFPASPGFAVDIKSPLVLLGHEGNDLEFEKYGKQDNDSQNSASDGLEQPVTIAQNVLLDVLEKVLASENNNVESGEEEHLGGRKSLSSSESPLQYPELEKVQLCSDDSEYDFEQYRVHSVPKQSVHDKDGLEGQELTGDFQEDRKLEVDQLWAYDSEDHKSDDSVPLGMRVAGSDVEEEEELKGESRVVYPVNEMAGAQGGDACQAQGKIADHEAKSTGGLQVVNMDSPKPEYPLNYDNYKVCRVLSPGVKECLILETGEHVICRNRGTPKNPPGTGDTGSAHTGSGSSSVGRFSREGVRRKMCKFMHAYKAGCALLLLPELTA